MYRASIALLCSLATVTATAATLEEIRAEHGLPALTAGQLTSGSISVQTAGVRKLSDATAATDTDSWHLGSNTKAITATLGAILVEKGFLTWDTTVAEVFPEWNVHPHYRTITLKELFAHRAGVHADISTFQGGQLWRRMWEPNADQVALRQEFAKATVEAPPETDGSKWIYSNSGYMVAGQMLSKVTGKTWETLVEDYVFGPLHMRCGFGAPGKTSDSRVLEPWPHLNIAGVLTPVMPTDLQSDNPPALGPAGTIHCSMRDWLRFAKAHLDGFNGRDTVALTARGFAKLHEDYKGQGYTSGGFIYEKREGKTYLGHNGTNGMNFALLVLDTANDKAYVSVTNAGGLSGLKGARATMISAGSPDVCMGELCLLK